MQADSTTCSGLAQYWFHFGPFLTLSNVFGYEMAPSPIIAILGVPPDSIDLPNQITRMNAFASLVARQLLLLKLKINPPSYDYWIRDIMQNLRKLDALSMALLSEL